MHKEKNVLGVRKELVIVYICIVAVISLFCNVGQAFLYSRALDTAEETCVMLDNQYKLQTKNLAAKTEDYNRLKEEYDRLVMATGQ